MQWLLFGLTYSNLMKLSGSGIHAASLLSGDWVWEGMRLLCLLYFSREAEGVKICCRIYRGKFRGLWLQVVVPTIEERRALGLARAQGKDSLGGEGRGDSAGLWVRAEWGRTQSHRLLRPSLPLPSCPLYAIHGGDCVRAQDSFTTIDASLTCIDHNYQVLYWIIGVF